MDELSVVKIRFAIYLINIDFHIVSKHDDCAANLDYILISKAP